MRNALHNLRGKWSVLVFLATGVALATPPAWGTVGLDFVFAHFRNHYADQTYNQNFASLLVSSRSPGDFQTFRISSAAGDTYSTERGGHTASFETITDLKNYLHAQNPWTISFDKGLPSESVYQLNVNLDALDAFTIPEFSITYPTAGNAYVSQRPTITWTRPTASTPITWLFFNASGGFNEWPPLGTTSWTPPLGKSLAMGPIEAAVEYNVGPDGLVSPLTHISGRDVTLNLRPLVRTVETVNFTVVPEPALTAPALLAGAMLLSRRGLRTERRQKRAVAP